MGPGVRPTKWRSNSPKKDLKLVRRSSYSPVHQPTPINYELYQQFKKSVANPRDLRAERKLLKSAHPSLINLKGQKQFLQNNTVRYKGMGNLFQPMSIFGENQTTKNHQTLKKIKVKKMQSAHGPNKKHQ